jgi:cytochrome c-type biogenesis protein CcmH/NrfG
MKEEEEEAEEEAAEEEAAEEEAAEWRRRRKMRRRQRPSVTTAWAGAGQTRVRETRVTMMAIVMMLPARQ